VSDGGAVLWCKQRGAGEGSSMVGGEQCRQLVLARCTELPMKMSCVILSVDVDDSNG